jgi:2'-5' RNA ligase
MRTFIGIALPASVRHEIAGYIDGLRAGFPGSRVGWEKGEKLHITIKFLGNTDESQLIDLKQVLEGVAAGHRAFIARLSDTGIFPNLRRPGVLWLGVSEGKESIISIANTVESECEHLEFPSEKRTFSPHLTIGRVRELQKARDLATTHLRNDFESKPFAVDEVILYESKLSSAGSVYTAISKQRLKDS